MNLKYAFTFLFSGLILTLVSCQEKSNDQQQQVETPVKDISLFVGTYTKKGSEGIYYYKFNPKTGESRQVAIGTDIENPSFLALSADGKYLYSVSEADGIGVVAFAVTDSSLIKINQAKGAGGCYIAIDKTGKWAITGNYGDGSLSVYPILADGSIGESVQTVKHTGSGPNKERQGAPHVHSVNFSPNNKDVFVPDLGIDKVMAYRFNDSTGILTEGNSIAVTPGSGPRHFTFSPDEKHAYVIQELTNKVTAFNYKDGNLEAIEEVSTLPEGFDDKSFCADIHISPDGKFLYGSNRYHDTIVVFEIDPATGKLTQVSHHSVMGAVPRNFALTPDGKKILVANQDTDNIVIFDRDEKTGKISPTGQEIKVSMPVCLVWGN